LEKKWQHSTISDFTSRYKFNGKELDQETGWYYYGARYYDPAVSQWLSVDPLAEKYPAFTPYNYTMNNPVVLVDLDGRDIWIRYKGNLIKYVNGNLYDRDGNKYRGKGVRIKKDGSIKLKGFLKKTVKALDKIRKGGEHGKQLISELQKSDKHTIIRKGDESKAAGTMVSWDPNNTSGAIDENGNTYRPSYISLAHELAHAYDALDGDVDISIWFMVGSQEVHNAEKYATFWENKIRVENCLPLRKYYAIDNGQGKGLLINGTYSLFYKQLTISSKYNFYSKQIKQTPELTMYKYK